MKHILCKSRQLTKNKQLEYQVYKIKDGDYFQFNLKWTRWQDHAGFTFEFEILGYCLRFEIYDTRHWDNKRNGWNNDWEKNSGS